MGKPRDTGAAPKPRAGSLAGGPASLGPGASTAPSLLGSASRGWTQRGMLEAATTSAQVFGVIYSTHSRVPWRAGSLLHRQLPGVQKRAWSPCDGLYSKVCPVADGSFLQVTY